MSIFLGKLWLSWNLKSSFWSLMSILAVNWSSKEFNIMAQMQDAFNHFIKTGQVWALIIGFVVGYIFRSFTAY